MKKLIVALPLFAALACLRAVAATSPVPAPAAISTAPLASSASNTFELNVFGMNCSLCSAEMKAELKKVAGASDIEPRLECGKIYVDLPPGTRLNDQALAAALQSNGFTYEGAKPATKSLAQVRKTAQGAC